MPILIRSEYTDNKKISLRKIKQNAEILLNICQHQLSELSILLVSDQQMQEINNQYRQKNKPTNVLSFPLQNGTDIKNGSMLGDIVISVDTANKEADERGISLGQRIDRLLVHGFVHLLGYDHELSDADAQRMESLEQEIHQKLIQQERRITMTHLAINVDHVATLRQARGIDEPDPVLAAGICELAGARGIVVHLREDRRHIQDRDIHLLRQTIKTKMNLEMGANKEIINIALDVMPDMVTLVPEKRQELTTEGGLDVAGQSSKLGQVIKQFSKADIPVSLFIDPEEKQIKASVDAGATFVEIHTGRYCDAENETEQEMEFDLVAGAAEYAKSQGLRVYAGHGLNYLTTSRVAALDAIEELSIGHSVMARAIFVGLDQAVREMLDLVSTL